MRRLWCVLTRHRGRGWMHHEWTSRGRVIWMNVCDCGTLKAEGNSDGWILVDWVARDLRKNAMAAMDWMVRDVVRRA